MDYEMPIHVQNISGREIWEDVQPAPPPTPWDVGTPETNGTTSPVGRTTSTDPKPSRKLGKIMYFLDWLSSGKVVESLNLEERVITTVPPRIATEEPPGMVPNQPANWHGAPSPMPSYAAPASSSYPATATRSPAAMPSYAAPAPQSKNHRSPAVTQGYTTLAPPSDPATPPLSPSPGSYTKDPDLSAPSRPNSIRVNATY
ncbi:hypothetical protein OUZ56_005287 [Daphnia magna]|uniref:Uncharacterized protein n=1 Tax=Daphnia magna TaxID=35525 RepID=A0ABQ9YSD7_9CRUS|nr:hypothetical protein OUZ56_005287 [Daphnia magna]